MWGVQSQLEAAGLLPDCQVLEGLINLCPPGLAGGSPVPRVSALGCFHSPFAPYLSSSSAVCLSFCGTDPFLPVADLDAPVGPRWLVFL